MFDGTLEAQSLHAGERHLSSMSVAVMAHLGAVSAIVFVSSFFVPPIKPPEPAPVFVPIFSAGISIDDLKPPAPEPPRARKGTDAPAPVATPRPPKPIPEPPSITPPQQPSEPPENALVSDSEHAGRGTPGRSDGSDQGTGLTEGSGNEDGGGSDIGEPVEVTGEMIRPILLERVEPAYPDAARIARLGGRVTLRAVIAEDGAVESVEVLASTSTLFNDAAVDAVRKWRYRPALMNGKPVRVYFTVVVTFVVR